MKKVTKVIDYKATLQEFFKEVLKFLDNRAAYAKDEFDYQKICKAREDVKQIAENPQKYADYAARVADGVDPQPEAFMPNQYDNSAYIILSKVLHYMGNLDSEFDWYREEAQDILLKANHAMRYKNAKGMFKDIRFLFISPKGLAKTKQLGR